MYYHYILASIQQMKGSPTVKLLHLIQILDTNSLLPYFFFFLNQAEIIKATSFYFLKYFRQYILIFLRRRALCQHKILTV